MLYFYAHLFFCITYLKFILEFYKSHDKVVGMSLQRQLLSEKDVQQSNSAAEPTLPTNACSKEPPVNDLVLQLRAARALAQAAPAARELDYWGPVRLPDLYPILGIVSPEKIISAARKSLKDHFGVDKLDYREAIELKNCLQMALQCLIVDDQVAEKHNLIAADAVPFRLLHPVAEGIFRWISIRMPDWTCSPVPNLYLQQKFKEQEPYWISFREKLAQSRLDWPNNFVTVDETYQFSVPSIVHYAELNTQSHAIGNKGLLNLDQTNDGNSSNSLLRDSETFDANQLKA